MIVTPEQLGVDDAAGTGWHPSKPDAYTEDGLLPDLDDDQVLEHQAKPEADDAEDILAAEDSALTPDGVV